jgi:asparaginyl-tRNA synthetase
MLGVYDAKNGKISYVGNNIRQSIDNVKVVEYSQVSSKQLLSNLTTDEHLYHLHRIDAAVFNAAVDYFRSINADWCNLPLTTKMISSPGEVYAGKKLDYTTDALPVNLEWFDQGNIFLSESSQFYLELRLIIDQLDKVFSIYNSFRKEPADFSHLSEFQHIEFEGIVSFEENVKIYIGLLKHMTDYLIEHCSENLAYYLSKDEIEELKHAFDEDMITTLTFTEAMKLLLDHTADKKYETVSLKNFGSYEEVTLTRILNTHCNVTEFPLEEIPFYHDEAFINADGHKFAHNADFIMLGYREVVGSGQRITNIDAIRQKADFFNLPVEDYAPYIDLRLQDTYKTTCGFGVGWQRYTQWLTKMPFIWDVSHIPRGHHAPRP